jgi:hypothetical protein
MEVRMIMNIGKTPQVFIIENPKDRFLDKEKAIYEAIDELEALLKSIKKEESEG